MQAADVLSALVGARIAHRPSECAALLLSLTADPSPSFQQVAEAAVAGLDGIGMPKSEPMAMIPSSGGRSLKAAANDLLLQNS